MGRLVLAERAALAALGLALCVRPAAALSGTGPGGYTWKDCQEPGGPACTFVSTAVSDGSTGLCSDELFNDPFDNLGFSFPFYQSSYPDYIISANGIVYLSNPPPSGLDVLNADLSGLEGRPMIAVLWDDWAMDNWDESFGFCPRDPECSNSGWEPLYIESFARNDGTDAGVRFKDFGWISTAHHDPCTEDWNEQATFALRLYQDGRILFLYDDTSLGSVALDDGFSATIGISSGVNGEFTLFSFDTASIPFTPYAILFEPPPCPALDCTSITVTPDPACQAAGQTFTANFTGGQLPVVVDWDFNGDTVRDTSGNPVSRTLGPGTYSVSATIRDACTRPAPQTCVLTTTTRVLPLPSPTATAAGPTIFCGRDGGSVRLDASFGFSSYQWQVGGVDIPGETGVSIVVTTSGSYVVEVTDADGCVGTSRPIVVNADDCPPPCAVLTCLSVTATPDPACQGASQLLQASWAGGDGTITVSWDFDGDTTEDATGASVIHAFLPGTHSVTATVTDSCTVPPGAQTCSMPRDVVVNPTPTPTITPGGATSFCGALGESVVLQATPGFASYQWRKDGADLAGETSPSTTATATGSYVVVVTDSAGCSGLSAAVAVDADDCTPGCATLACGAITITPDPSCGGDTQDLSLAFSGGEGVVTVEWDWTGDTVADATGNPASVMLPVGALSIRALATDSCGTPQICSTTQPATVLPGASVLSEVSGPAALPLKVSPGGATITVATDPAATAYNVHSDVIGTYAPSAATGTTCHVTAWTDNGDGTITLDVPIADDHWVVVTSSNHCGEGSPGVNSLGSPRGQYVGWIPCGAAP